MYQPLVLRAMQGAKSGTKNGTGQTQQMAVEMTIDFTKFMVKRFSVIRDIGLVLEKESVQMSRVLSILPCTLKDRRSECLETTAKMMEPAIDLISLKQLVASTIILESNSPNVTKKLYFLLMRAYGDCQPTRAWTRLTSSSFAHTRCEKSCNTTTIKRAAN